MEREEGPTESSNAQAQDALGRFGYKQELEREIGWFSSFAFSFSIVAVTTGLFATYGSGLEAAGPVFIWTWPAVGAGQFLLAMVFAKLARVIPLSGSVYQWTRELSGDRIAWWAGWLMIVQILTGLAAVCYALASYLLPACGLAATDRNLVMATVGVLISIACVNHIGIKTATLVNNIMVGVQIVGIFAVGIALLAYALIHKTHSFHFLFTHPGHPGGLAFVGPLAFSSLAAAWTITGFESAANLAEETKLPERRVPFAILSSEIFCVIVGFLTLLGFTLAIPSLDATIHSSSPLIYIVGRYFSSRVTAGITIMILVEVYACALANLALLTRIVWAMARDRQLPGSHWLGKIGSRKIPARAMWLATIVTIVFTWWAKFEVVFAGVSTLAAYSTYAMVVASALWGRSERLKAACNLTGRSVVPKSLGIPTLLWMFVCLGALTIPRSAWINLKAIAAAAIIGLGVWLAQKKFNGPLTGIETAPFS